MGQQPNIDLEISDLPRPVPQPGPARRWRPDRPGELRSPEEVPWGGAYGTPGPDTGFVLRLIARRELALADGESRHDVAAALAALASARASLFGRAPVDGDVDFAMVALGLDPTGLPDTVVAQLGDSRRSRVTGAAHEPARMRGLVGAVPLDVLRAGPEEIRLRLAAGESPFTS